MSQNFILQSGFSSPTVDTHGSEFTYSSTHSPAKVVFTDRNGYVQHLIWRRWTEAFICLTYIRIHTTPNLNRTSHKCLFHLDTKAIRCCRFASIPPTQAHLSKKCLFLLSLNSVQNFEKRAFMCAAPFARNQSQNYLNPLELVSLNALNTH